MSDFMRPTPAPKLGRIEFSELIDRDSTTIIVALRKIMRDDETIKWILNRCLEKAWSRYYLGVKIESIRSRMYRGVISDLVKQCVAEMIAAKDNANNESKT